MLSNKQQFIKYTKNVPLSRIVGAFKEFIYLLCIIHAEAEPGKQVDRILVKFKPTFAKFYEM